MVYIAVRVRSCFVCRWTEECAVAWQPMLCQLRDLALDVGFGHALTQQFQATLSQIHHFALILVFKLGLSFDLSVCNSSDVLDNVVGFANMTNQSLIFRLE